MTESFSLELERLADEQLHDEDGITRRQRCSRVCDIAVDGGIVSGADFYHAAVVLLHGETPEEFATALHFARTSAKQDEPRAWSVVAATWDRLLIAKRRPQRFGTQFVKIDGKWSLGAVDANITDAERAFYGVPPLWVQQKNAELLQRRDESR